MLHRCDNKSNCPNVHNLGFSFPSVGTFCNELKGDVLLVTSGGFEKDCHVLRFAANNVMTLDIEISLGEDFLFLLSLNEEILKECFCIL